MTDKAEGERKEVKWGNVLMITILCVVSIVFGILYHMTGNAQVIIVETDSETSPPKVYKYVKKSIAPIDTKKVFDKAPVNPFCPLAIFFGAVSVIILHYLWYKGLFYRRTRE